MASQDKTEKDDAFYRDRTLLARLMCLCNSSFSDKCSWDWESLSWNWVISQCPYSIDYQENTLQYWILWKGNPDIFSTIYNMSIIYYSQVYKIITDKKTWILIEEVETNKQKSSSERKSILPISAIYSIYNIRYL